MKVWYYRKWVLSIRIFEKSLHTQQIPRLSYFYGGKNAKNTMTCANSIKNDFERLYVMGKRLNYIDNLRSITVFLTINCKNSPSSVGGEMNCNKLKKNTCSGLGNVL